MKSSNHYSSVKKVTKLRNACAHNDARFISNDDSQIPELVDLMRTYSTEFGEDGKQVNFKAGSLQAMTDILKNYFDDVQKALKVHKIPDPFIAFRQ